MKLISSNGGPFILLERRLLPFWGGTDNVGGVARNDPGESGIADQSDYVRASAITGWLRTISVADGQAVVFWGDRIQLGVTTIRATGLLIVRPFYEVLGLEHSISRALRQGDAFKKVSSFKTSTEDAIVFDCAFPGLQIRSDFIDVKLSPGRYEVATHEDKTQNREIVFHKFDFKADA